MTPEMDVTAPVRAFYAAINEQDAGSFDTFMDENIELIDFGLGKQMKGREEVKKYFKNWWTAFPEGTGEIKETLITRNQVVIEARGRGKQTGPFELEQDRLEASNQELDFHFAHICRVENGKIVSMRSYSDAYRILVAASKKRRAAA